VEILKKILLFILIIIIITSTLIGSYQNNMYVTTRKPVKVGVFLYDFNDPYLSLLKQNLEDIQKENENKVEFTFFDGKANQTIQNESIDKVLKGDVDLLIVSLVDPKTDALQDIINKIIQRNIPLILYSDPTPTMTNFIKSYSRALIVATDAEQSGILQGKILVAAWNTDKKTIDKNGDNIMQYVMLHGETDSPIAIARTKYSVLTINDAGIKTEKLALKFCDWNQECAKNAIKSLLLNYSNKIEVIIANNDAMAIGAIEALQEYGYNKGDKAKTIPVVGIDAIPTAQNLIKKGFMTGTVVQDPRVAAEALYTVGMNLVSGKNALEGTNYNFDNTGIAIHLPYNEYIK